VVIAQKGAVLISFAVEAWNHTMLSQLHNFKL